MTKSCFVSIVLLLVLTSCTGSVRTDTVDFTQAFTDGNSKVWMINKVRSQDGAYTMPEQLKQEVIVFYESGNCFLTNLQKLSKGKGVHGRLEFNHEKHQVTIFFPSETREFEFEFTNENELNLYPLEGSDYPFALELIPFPEFR